jgi:hypothetical protein
MKVQLSAVRWKRVGLAIGFGLAVMLSGASGYAKWKTRNGWCVRYHPNGAEQILYGADCQKPSTHTGI